MLRPSAEQMQNAARAMAEEMRDKQDDDWSGYCGFVVDGYRGILGGYYWRVLANGHQQVGVYDSSAEASRVKAKLEYRRREPIRAQIGLDGLSS